MSRKLYYADSYTLEFDVPGGQALERDGRAGVLLEATYFYPTSGGQPHDLGVLGAARVVDVTDEDEGVVHWLEGEPGPAPWAARIDAARRADHMQQHTGQHVLSQAFIQALQAPTVSFHLGAETATIDVQLGSALRVAQAEALANRIVAQGVPVRAYEVSPEEIEALGLRKPPAARDRIRIVEVEGFDKSACGGTHVANTAQIQLIKVLGTETVRDTLRVEFVCGQRALRDYARKQEALLRLGARFTTGWDQVEGILERKQEEAAAQRKQVEGLENELAALEADAMAAAAEARPGGSLLVRWLEGKGPSFARALASRLRTREKLVFALGAGDPVASWILGHGPGLELDLRPLWKQWCAASGARGGGQPDLIQGGGAAGDPRAALASLGEALKAALEPRP